MRFLLDQDVDAHVVELLVEHGHDAWSVADAGLVDASDEVVALYARAVDAVLVTHDAAFARRQRRRGTGRTVWLRCPEPDAVQVVEGALPFLLAHLGEHATVPGGGAWVRVRATDVRVDRLSGRAAGAGGAGRAR